MFYTIFADAIAAAEIQWSGGLGGAVPAAATEIFSALVHSPDVWRNAFQTHPEPIPIRL